MNNPNKKTILGIVAENENEALTATTDGYCSIFRPLGYNALTIDFRKPESIQLFQEHLRNNDMAFAFGLQGVGSCLRAGDNKTSLWSAFKVPFIGLHHDHPCYNYNNHVCDSPFVANVYHYESFLETKEKYLPSQQISIVQPFGLLVDMKPPLVPFDKRSINLLYLKSGTSPAAMKEDADYWDELPKPVQDAISQQLEQARVHANLQLCDLVSDLFSSLGYDYHELQPTFWGVVRYMDRTLRRERSVTFVEWLKNQDGAVIIGNGWDFIEKKSARAEFRPAVPSYKSYGLYAQSRIVCNTNPYCRDMIHERTVFGLSAGACIITDTNSWWDEHGSGCPSILLYDWARPLDEQLHPLLAQTDVIEQAAANSHNVSRSLFSKQDISGVFNLVDNIRAQTGTAL
ncbi:MAG: hypothetical protein PHD48_10245 [Alphaproteobacteria bacterium]|nr:hypothetical protein [Alphaproteobacteria bacterium]